MSISGREALPDDRLWSGVPAACPGVVEKVSRMSGSFQEVLSDVQKWSGSRPKCPGVVGRPF